MFIMLGDIGYAKLTSPSALDLRRSLSYAEHQVIEGKPLLQYTGAALDEINLTFLFHADFCVPQKKWDELAKLARDNRAVPLSQGDGLWLGNFVITGLDRVSVASGADGAPHAIECRVALKEYVDPTPLETKRKQRKEAAPAVKQPGGKAKKPTRKSTAATAAIAPTDTATAVKRITRQ